MVSLIFDLIALALIIIMVAVSAKKGFLSGVVSFIGWIVSAFVAKAFCTVVADYVYNGLIQDKIYNAVLSALENYTPSLSSSYSELFASLPESLQSILGSVDPELLNSAFSDPLRTSETVALQLTQDVVGPVVMTMLIALSFIVIFLLCMLIVKLLAGLFKGVKKIPVIGPINTFLGGVIGAIEAVIILYLVKITIEFVTTAAGGNLFGLTFADFSSSYIFQFFNLNFRGLL